MNMFKMPLEELQLPFDPNNYLESILCVFWNLTHELVEEIDGKLIEEIVDVIITAFETFQIVKK